MTDPSGQRPGEQSPPPPVPPYAAHLYGAAPAGPHATQAAPYGAPQQAYPGAPPTWGAPPPAPEGSAALAGTALGLAIAGALIALIPFVGLAAWLFLVPAVVLAIIALVRKARGRGMAIGALVTSGVGMLIAIVWALGTFAFGNWLSGLGDAVDDSDSWSDDDYSYDYPSLGIDPSTGGTTRDDALPFGSTILVRDDNSGEDVWSITVQAPEDATQAASADVDLPPQNGAYLAVPVELTNLTDEDIDLDYQYEYTPYSWLLTGDGGRAESTYLSAETGFIPLWDLGVVEPGETVTYYEVFDVAASVATSGYLVIELDSGDLVHWGGAAAE